MMKSDTDYRHSSDDRLVELTQENSVSNEDVRNKSPNGEVKRESFAEAALRLGGASAEEARRTGAVDTADDQVEDLFASPYRTANSPIHRAVWDKTIPTELFCPKPLESSDLVRSEYVQRVVERSIAIVKRHRNDQTLYRADGKISDESVSDLASAGYWGMLVDTTYGGCGATIREFTKMITRMATVDPTVAGLASVHGCIGAVDPLRAFGNALQKQRFLPSLASGKRLSGFALTEPGAGSDLTALRTYAVRQDDHYIVNGEKLFITNACLGRTVGLVCKIEGEVSVLIVDLPASESDSFYLKRYGIYALRRAENNGLVFKNFRVPVENRLMPDRGDGLTIAYHGLNLGRVALCANAAGAMRCMLAEMLPWAKFRHTYGQAIANRELVQRRIGRLAGFIVACDALSDWCSSLLDDGYRSEMECIIAKIFGSESQKEAAIELFMKTHGGRSFLHGHLFGDNVHDFLAPCIYEGEGEMLGMAFFKSLVKEHGKRYFEPIGRKLHSMNLAKPNLLNPSHLWALRQPMFDYARWYAGRRLSNTTWVGVRRLANSSSDSLRDHVRDAQDFLSGAGLRISGTMRRFQLKLADRQCRMSALSSSVQNAVTILVTALYAAGSSDPLTQAAADTVCRELKYRINGGKPTDSDFRQVTELGRRIAQSNWKELRGVDSSPVMQSYDSEED
jgi:alkylation response protein AidB-like acyl-CoA dehydrogenase